MSDFDSLVDDSAAQQAPQNPVPDQQVPSFDDLQDDSEKYGTPGQQAIAGAEGVAKGVLGPFAPFAERMAHVAPEDIRGRAEANPITHGVGEAAGLTAGFVGDFGLPSVMADVGRAAETASGIGKTSIISKIGSAAVQQAAEMAVLQSGDEVGKRILQDPDASVETALTNVGLASVLGGAFGGVIGASGALWSATAGPKVEEALNLVKNHVNGEIGEIVPSAIKKAAEDLGIEVDPAIKSMMSENPKAREFGSDLIRAEHPSIKTGIDKLNKDATASVQQSLGIPIEDVAYYSENEAGHELADTVKKEFDEKYEPIAKALDKRNEVSAKINVPDESRLNQYGKILEKGMNKWGTDSPMYKNYYEWGNRLLAKDTIGGIDQIKTEIGGEIGKALRAGDTNTYQALSEIRNSMDEFQEREIKNQAAHEGLGKLTIAYRTVANDQYKQFRSVMDELTDYLGIGRASGYKGLISKIYEKVSPEQLLNKFSPRGNADILPFLEKNFPDTLEKVRQNEVKRLLKGSIKMESGEPILDYKKLGKAVEAAKKGKKELVDFALSPEAQRKIAAANILSSSLPNPKNSGTPAGLIKLLKHAPIGALGSIGWLMGHGPLGAGAGAVLGHLSEKLGVEAPQAIKLAYLRLLSSEQPVKAEGFKAAVDFMHNAYKGEALITKSVSNVFKSGIKDVISSSTKLPDAASRVRLDKLVASTQDNPNDEINKNPGYLGHYLPQQQTAVTASSLRAIQYLQSLRPTTTQNSPLDAPSQPTKIQIARYNRALDIAHQPAIVLQHIKDGTLQSTDLQDLNAMYPALAQVMVQKVSNEMINHKVEDGNVPYKTRIGLSLFLGQPIDSTMTPASIQAAQPVPKQPPQPSPNKPTKNTAKLGSKTNNMYKTPSQAAESDRSSRD